MPGSALLRALRTTAEILQKRPGPFGRLYNFNAMDRKRFQKLVEQALARLPERFRKKLTNVAITVEDSPAREHRVAAGEGLLLGLFHGVPLTEKSVFQATPPDRILLYQKNIEAVCATDEEVCRQVRDTLLHEVGHYFGLNEDELADR